MVAWALIMPSPLCAGSGHGCSLSARVPWNGQPSELVDYSGRVQLGRHDETSFRVSHGIRPSGSIRLYRMGSDPHLTHSHRSHYIHHRPDPGEGLQRRRSTRYYCPSRQLHLVRVWRPDEARFYAHADGWWVPIQSLVNQPVRTLWNNYWLSSELRSIKQA